MGNSHHDHELGVATHWIAQTVGAELLPVHDTLHEAVAEGHYATAGNFGVVGSLADSTGGVPVAARQVVGKQFLFGQLQRRGYPGGHQHCPRNLCSQPIGNVAGHVALFVHIQVVAFQGCHYGRSWTDIIV